MGYLGKLKDEYNRQYRTNPYKRPKDFRVYMEETRTMIENPSPETETRLKHDSDQISGVLRENIDKALNRGQNLEVNEVKDFQIVEKEAQCALFKTRARIAI